MLKSVNSGPLGPTGIEHVQKIFDGPDLAALLEFLRSLEPRAMIVDLNGRTIGGTLPLCLDNEVTIDRDGLRIRNGELELPAGACIVFRAPSELLSGEMHRGSRISSSNSLSSYSSGYCSSNGSQMRARMALENVTVSGTGGKPVDGSLERSGGLSLSWTVFTAAVVMLYGSHIAITHST